MLDAPIMTQLREHFQHLRHPVRLTLTLGSDEASSRLRALVEDLTQTTDHLIVHTRSPENGERVPSLGIQPDSESGPARVVFAAVPLGHEFSSLVLAVLQAGGHPVKVDDETQARIRALPGPLHWTTYLSLSCQNCPEVVQALNVMALLNPAITHTAVDGGLFEKEVAARQILAVPTLDRNGAIWKQGRQSLAEILDALDADGPRPVVHDGQPPYDILIVGGGPAATAAAVYAARKGVRTALVAERLGGQVLDTMAIENFVSVLATEGPRLARELEAHVRAHEVDLWSGRAVTNLIPGTSEHPFHQLSVEAGATLQARTVILATGARWRNLGVPGETEYRNKGVTYCPHCDGPLFKGKTVAVVGGGNSGVEAAIDLAGLAKQVTLVEYAPALRADAILQRKLESLPNVRVITHAQPLGVTGNGQRVEAMMYQDRTTGEEHRLTTDGVFVQIGLVPNTEWLRSRPIRLSERGEVDVNDRAQTSLPGVFAAGDCTTVPYKQIVVAIGQGATAALSAFDHLIRQPTVAQETSGA